MLGAGLIVWPLPAVQLVLIRGLEEGRMGGLWKTDDRGAISQKPFFGTPPFPPTIDKITRSNSQIVSRSKDPANIWSGLHLPHIGYEHDH